MRTSLYHNANGGGLTGVRGYGVTSSATLRPHMKSIDSDSVAELSNERQGALERWKPAWSISSIHSDNTAVVKAKLQMNVR